MRVSPLHQRWFRQRRAAKLRHSYDIVDQFISQNQASLSGTKGIVEEHTAVDAALKHGRWSQVDDKRETRYGETAYLIWALGTELGRNDLLTANISNWDSGIDDGSGSSFRNLEFEAHVALRFVEEGFDVRLAPGSGKAEMIVEDTFAVECKRPTQMRGVYYGALKARKQIAATGKPGLLVVNLDDLQGLDINPANYEQTQSMFDRLSVIAEHGFGNLDSEIIGAAFEYVFPEPAIARAGSYVQASGNCTGTQFLNHQAIFQQFSVGLTGDLSAVNDLLPSRVLAPDRFQGVYDKSNKQPMIDHYDDVIDG